MELIKIDKNLCTNCGICIKECPTFVLDRGTEKPKAVLPQNCFACGHCAAVCPNGALENSKAALSKQELFYPGLDPDSAEQFMRSRRSIRSFREQAVPKDLLTRLVNLARYAPTGSNTQGVAFLVIQDKTKVKKAAELTIEWLEKSPLAAQGFIPTFIQAYRNKGIDSILRGAPHLVLTITEGALDRGRECAISMLTYLELFAPALGLGSCWAGVFELCAMSGYEPFLELFEIPEGKKIAGAVMVGYPKYTYHRLPERNPLEVSFQ